MQVPALSARKGWENREPGEIPGRYRRCMRRGCCTWGNPAIGKLRRRVQGLMTRESEDLLAPCTDFAFGSSAQVPFCIRRKTAAAILMGCRSRFCHFRKEGKSMKLRKKGRVILPLLLAALLAIGYLGLKTAEPADPTRQQADASRMLTGNQLAEEAAQGSGEAATLYYSAGSSETLLQAERRTEPDSGETQEHDGQSTDSGGEGGGNAATDNSATGAGQTEAEQPGDQPGGEMPLPSGGGAGKAWFKTSITDGETVDAADYAFVLTHLDRTVTPRGIQVSCNGESVTCPAAESRFTVALTQGENRIRVTVLYKGGEGEFYASCTYRVYYAPGGALVLVTDLTNCTVQEENLAFQAYGMKDGRRMAAAVTVNGQVLSAGADGYHAVLVPGSNTIVITTGGRGESITQTYTVVYRTEQFYIRTSLSDTEITAARFAETVTCRGAEPSCRFWVRVYGPASGQQKLLRVWTSDGSGRHTLTPDGEGYYRVTLNARQAVTVTLEYSDEQGQSYSFRYEVRYQRPAEATDAAHEPGVGVTVQIGSTNRDLVDGMSFRTDQIILNVTPTSYAGEQLNPSCITVQYNDTVKTRRDYINGNASGYDVQLQEGTNRVAVTVTDYDGYTVTREYTLYYARGQITVTVSVEATTVGLGTLIAPTRVTVDGGTNIEQIITGLLEQNGYSYTSSGTTGFYLSSIRGPGISDGYHIPEDLLQAMQEDGMDLGDGKPVSSDSLGEFDFFRWSGWMYSVNGEYPGLSVSNFHPEDGAVIRVRYTLALGKDIGGYDPSGGAYGNGNSNYSKEW